MKASNIAWIVLAIIVLVGVSFFFWPAPTPAAPANWLTFTDEADVYTFKYPPDFGSEYVTPVDWPPQVNLLEGTTLTCTEAGAPTERAGETRRQTIDGQDYCVTVVSEGAAGSIYNQYAYLTKHDDQIIGLTFTARLPQCLNYDEPKQSECQADQAAFNPAAITDQIINSFVFSR